MAEITENKEQKRPRGRPPKQAPSEINEGAEQLRMSKQEASTKKASSSTKEPVKMEQVQANLTQFYNQLLGVSGITSGWAGGLFNFNTYNPFLQNQRLKMINTYPNEMTTEELTNAVSNPIGSEQALRSEGWSLSSSQYLYYKILRLAADIPKFKYYKTPQFLADTEYLSPKFVKEDEFTEDWLKHLDVVNTFKRMSLEIKREGKPTYLLRNSISKGPNNTRTTNYVAFQKLPSNYVKLTGIGEHGYIASFNMLVFMNPAFSLEQYPDYIKDIWFALMDTGAVYENPQYQIGGSENKYAVDINKLNAFQYYPADGNSEGGIKGTIAIDKGDDKNQGKRGFLRTINYMYWIQLPQEVCYTFCSDTSNAWALPDTIGLFLGLRELTDYDTLAGLIQSTPLTALLTAEAETVTNPNPGQNQTVLSPETIAGFQDKFNNSTSTNLESFFAPLKNFKLLSLPNIPNSSDITSNATKNFISRAGLAGLIPVTDKPSVAQIKGSQLIEESQCDFVTKQLESVVNFIINNLIGCEYKWNVTLWGNIFTYSEEVKAAKELFISGGTFALPKLASAYGMSLRDVHAVQAYIKSLGLYDNFQTVTQAQQKASDQTSNTGEDAQIGAGRPEVDDSEIDNDNTAASKEGGLDTADMRDFDAFDGHCIICGAESDEPLCEDCKEKYVEDWGGNV